MADNEQSSWRGKDSKVHRAEFRAGTYAPTKARSMAKQHTVVQHSYPVLSIISKAKIPGKRE